MRILNFDLFKKAFPGLLIIIVCFQFSCNNIKTRKNITETKSSAVQHEVKDSVPDQTFVVDTKLLTKDFNTWYAYTYYNVLLSQDFIGLNVDSLKIDKTTFLNKLISGNVAAFKIKIQSGEPVYKLYKLQSNDKSIQATIKQLASSELIHFKMEGTEIPEFSFTDLNGKTYNRSSTKGKIIVLKCWFINCLACVREFPECNKLVDGNKDRNDILFISLASNSRQDLVKFLKTKEFKYAVVPDMQNYMTNKLLINEYPTHLLIDKNGKIKKVVNDINELIPFLKKETRNG